MSLDAPARNAMLERYRTGPVLLRKAWLEVPAAQIRQNLDAWEAKDGR